MRISGWSSDVCSSDLSQHNSSVCGGIPRQHGQTAAIGWFRHQLEFAVRSLPDRYRQGAFERTRGRHQTLFVQHRDTILMRTFLKAAALAATALTDRKSVV